MKDVFMLAGLIALFWSPVVFQVWRKDERAGHEAAFGVLMLAAALSLGAGAIALVGWLIRSVF